MKKYLILIIFVLGFSFLNPLTTSANTNSNILVLKDEVNSCEGLLGEDLKQDLDNVLKIIRIAGPILVIFLTSFELIGAVTSKDDDALKKAMGKLTTRLILVAILFLLPTILNIVFKLIDARITTCIS